MAHVPLHDEKVQPVASNNGQVPLFLAGEQKLVYEQLQTSREVNLQPFYRNQEPLIKGVVNGRPMFGQVDVFLNPGETVLADAGAMTWMDDSLRIETSMHGGCMRGCGRACAQESCCLNTFIGPGRVGFSFPLPGDMMAFAVTPEFGWILSRGAFVCGTPNLQVSARFAGCCAACFSSEGLFLTKVTTESTPGLFFAGGYGSIRRHFVEAGKVFFVDNGMFFAAEQSTKLEIGIVGGVKALCCSGEGVVMKFYGPCTIFTQSRNPSTLIPPDPHADDPLSQ